MQGFFSTTPRYRLGVDIGGTFTDLCAVDSTSGRRIELKTPTIPSNPARGVANGIALLTQQGVNPEQIEYFVHGTTIALNAIIQRSGVRVALVVTEGFRDVLEMGRIRLPVPWDFYSRRPEPLVPRSLVIPVRERMRHDGVEIPLTEQEIERVVDELAQLDIDAVAVCLLHSYTDPSHEIALKHAIERRVPHLFVSASADIWPQMREYERSVVTVMNAYVQPILSNYLNTLEETLAGLGVSMRPYLTRSNGGIMTTTAAKGTPVETLLSGPASGVVGAIGVGVAAGYENLITFDMGGTSADVSLVEHGKASYSHDELIGDSPLILPAVGISSIGAGGGSIAWFDGAGVLKVGPKSAGAEPGPACYGRGGTEPTLSDAFLLCGYLNPEGFIGSARLDVDAAQRAMKPIANNLGLTVQDAASAVIQVAIANMYAELSAVLERKGIDPRDFTLVSFGGAGSVVACQLAAEVNIRRVLVPPSPGTLCAFGALNADVMSDFIRMVNWRLDVSPPERLDSLFVELKDRASMWLEQEAPAVAETSLVWSADMHYVGQSYEIEVPLDEAWISERNVVQIAQAFHAAHERIFYHSDEAAPVEIVNLRVRSIGYMPQPPVSETTTDETSALAPVGVRAMQVAGAKHESRVFNRRELHVGHEFQGPAIVEQAGSTTVIPASWVAEVDGQGNLIITPGGEF